MSKHSLSELSQVAAVGCWGMLGHDLVAALNAAGFAVTCLDRPQIDITNANQVIYFLREANPDLVINCAAYTAVDKAESEPELAFAVNREGSAHLAEACRDLEIPLIHISTDYVFDGRSEVPYREEDKASPLSVYGRSKWEGENVIRSCLKEHLIIRTSWLYGIHGHNFVKTIIALARERTEIRIVSDQFGSPTWTVDLANALVEITRFLQKNSPNILWGTYHFCGIGQTSWHGFAEAIISEAQLWESLKVIKLTPIATSDYPTPTSRPANSALDCFKIGRHFGIRPLAWPQALKAMIAQLYQR